jgi:hypothetical protein
MMSGIGTIMPKKNMLIESAGKTDVNQNTLGAEMKAESTIAVITIERKVYLGLVLIKRRT